MNYANATNKRNYKIDNIRAIAILLVVFGHSIILYSSSWNLYKTTNDVPSLDICKDIINLIQMPLFFALSGFLFVSTLQKKSFSLVLKDKTKRLLILYFVFAFFWLLPIRLIVKYSGYNIPIFIIIGKCIIYGSDNGHLWYLIALFWCFILCYIFSTIVETVQRTIAPPRNVVEVTQRQKIVVIFIISGIMFGLSKCANLHYFNTTFNYFIWFMLGSMIRINYKKVVGLSQSCKFFLGLGCLFSTIISILIRNNFKVAIISGLLSSLLWVILLFSVVPDKNNKILSFLSSMSFGLYLFHSPLIYITYTYIPNANPIIVVILNFLIGGIISILLTLLVSRSKIKFIIGE